MTFFRKHFMSKPWPVWSWFPFLVSLILLLSSAFVGLTDDEAYYWVLAQKPALGYAYHPPMVAWMIALSQFLLGWIFGNASTWVVRIPSCLNIGFVFYIALKWINPSRNNFIKPALILTSFAGLVALGWMMVPDEPLFLGWMIAFYASYRICENEASHFCFVSLAIGIFIAMLSKFSGVFVFFSAIVSIFFCGGRKSTLKAAAYCLVGLIVSLVPICVWNSQHEWSAILYQIKERHSDSDISWKRFLRFWLIELFAAGPVLVYFTVKSFARGLFPRASTVERFIAIWILPAGVIYCVQPLFSDFKPHWAFIVWWPGALLLAWQVSKREVKYSTTQIAYGLSVIAIVLISLNFPIMTSAIQHFASPRADRDLRLLDVTNDLYGWRKLKTGIPASDQNLVVTGSRYQTASQAAFALGGLTRVTLLPTEVRSRDEWPNLHVSETLGPEWPKLNQTVLFVTDNRYDAKPEYPNANCEKTSEVNEERWGMSAKSIWIWKCVPKN